MRFIDIKKIRDGKYLKNYELLYENKAGKQKVFEIVSYNELDSYKDLGAHSSGVVIFAIKNNSILLLREFRMGAGKFVYNLCAGRLEQGENIEECVRRELYEETGLKLVRIIDELKPAYSAITISDMKNTLVFAEVEGEISDHTSDNEEITASFYTKEQIKELLESSDFTSRAQAICYSFVRGAFD